MGRNGGNLVEDHDLPFQLQKLLFIFVLRRVLQKGTLRLLYRVVGLIHRSTEIENNSESCFRSVDQYGSTELHWKRNQPAVVNEQDSKDICADEL